MKKMAGDKLFFGRFKVFFFAAIVLFFAAGANADRDDLLALEADSLMRDCQLRQSSGQYGNALKMCYRAQRIYGQINDNRGVRQSQSRISDIEGILSDNQLAQIYYDIAVDYYLQTEKDINLLEQSEFFCEKAIDAYKRIGGATGSSGLLKSEDLLRNVQGKIQDSRNACIREGDQIYQKAQNALSLNDIISAREYALEASRIYTGCPYQIGVSNSADIMALVNTRMDFIRADAKAAYDQAIRYLTREEYELCMSRASESQRLYKNIGDEDGAVSATSVLSECDRLIIKNKTARRRLADILKEEAERFSLIPDCFNATDRANAARRIYSELRDEAYKKEEDLPRNQRHETNLYSSIIQEVNSLMQRITSVCNQERMLEIAEDYYRQSQDHYLNNEVDEALALALNSRNLFDQLKHYVGISKADSMISQIQRRKSQLEEAHTHLQNARSFKGNAQFEQALASANRANAIYRSIRQNEMQQTAEELIQEIIQGQKDLELGNEHFSKAKEAFDVEDWERASKQGQTAHEIFDGINYTVGASEAERIVKTSREMISKKRAEYIQFAIFIIVLVGLAAILLIQITKKQKTMEADYEVRKRAAEDEQRRRREELEIRTEGQTSDRVEDELKRLISRERSNLEGIDEDDK